MKNFEKKSFFKILFLYFEKKLAIGNEKIEKNTF
jgi:hypothetical protein